MRWAKVAAELRDLYVEERGGRGKCRLCGEQLYDSNLQAFKKLREIYKHFKEKHPDKLNEVKQRLAKREAPLLIDLVFKPAEEEVKSESKPEPEETEE